jgi:hypothetical protein
MTSSVLQNVNQIIRTGNFYICGQQQLLVCSSVSSNVQLATTSIPAATDILLFNAGSVNIFFTSGPTSAAAAVIPTAGNPAYGQILAPGAYLTFQNGSSNTYIAGITASGTANLYIAQGYGC